MTAPDAPPDSGPVPPPPAPSLPPAPPFASLAALQARHAELVRAVGRDLLDGENPERVVRFVSDAVASGAALDARADREAAQEIVGFWTARVATAAREKARAARRTGEAETAQKPVLPDFGDTLLADFNPATAAVAAADATARLRKLGADPTLVQQFLLRLVRLWADDPGAAPGDRPPLPAPPPFDTPQVTRASLRDLPGADDRPGPCEPRVIDRVIDELAAAGVVVVAPGARRAADLVGLRPAVLAVGWPPLEEALARRREFRWVARAAAAPPPPPTWWDRARAAVGDRLAALGRRAWAGASRVGRRFGWLPAAEQLGPTTQDDAEEYRDLNEPEVRLLRASRCLQRRLTEVNRALALLMLAAGVLLLAGWVTALVGLKGERTAKAAAHDALEKETLARKDADDALKEAKEKEKDRAARERLSGLRLLVRAQAKVIGAPPSDQARDMAEFSWAQVVKQLPSENFLEPATIDRLLDQAKQVQAGAGLCGRPDLQIDEIRAVRNAVAARPDTRATLRAIRAVSFATVRHATEKIDDYYKAQKQAAEYPAIAPYADEFWFQYWGEMLLVEGKTVEDAMVKFGQALDALREYRKPEPGAKGADPPEPTRLQVLQASLAEARGNLHDALRAEEAGELPIPAPKKD